MEAGNLQYTCVCLGYHVNVASIYIICVWVWPHMILSVCSGVSVCVHMYGVWVVWVTGCGLWTYFKELVSCNLYIKNFTCLMYIIWGVWTCAHMCEATTPIKVINISVSSQNVLVFFYVVRKLNMRSGHCCGHGFDPCPGNLCMLWA